LFYSILKEKILHDVVAASVHHRRGLERQSQLQQDEQEGLSCHGRFSPHHLQERNAISRES